MLSGKTFTAGYANTPGVNMCKFMFFCPFSQSFPKVFFNNFSLLIKFILSNVSLYPLPLFIPSEKEKTGQENRSPEHQFHAHGYPHSLKPHAFR